MKKAKKAGKTFVVHTHDEDSDDCEDSSVAEMSAVKVSAVKNSLPSQRKYYKQFDFFYVRTCFRIMNEYYKQEYIRYYENTWAANRANSDRATQKQGVSNSSKTLMATDKKEMDEIMDGFITEMFGDELLKSECVSEYQKVQIKNSMIMFSFAHRFTKTDNFLV